MKIKMISFYLAVFFVICLGIRQGAVANPNDLKTSSQLLPVPIVRQATSYSCGAASLLAVLYYWGATQESEFELHSPLKTTEELGTHPKSLVKFSQSLGLKAELKTEVTLAEIEASIDRKEPVIVDYQAWSDNQDPDYSNLWDDGHYGVIIGYDSERFYFMDPVIGTSYGQMEKQEFLKRWHDFEMENGIQQKYVRLAIFISGDRKLLQFPGPLKRIK